MDTFVIREESSSAAQHDDSEPSAEERRGEECVSEISLFQPGSAQLTANVLLSLLMEQPCSLQPPARTPGGPQFNTAQKRACHVHAGRSGQPTLMLIKCVYLCLFTD